MGALLELDSWMIWWYGLSWRLLPLMLHPTDGRFATLWEGVEAPLEAPLAVVLLHAGEGGGEGKGPGTGSGGFLPA